MKNPPSIAIVGAGAVGSVIAYTLQNAGLAPKLVARGATLAAIRRDGLRVDRPQGGGVVQIEASDDPVGLGPQDLVIGTMKAQDWPAGLATLRPLVASQSAVLPVINGVPWWYFDGVGGALAGEPIAAVDPGGTLLAALPARQVIGAVVYVGATRVGPGHVNWTAGGKFAIGEAAGGNRPRTEAVAEILRRAGLETTLTNDIRGEIWAKLLGNAAANPLSVVARARIDEMMDDPGLARLTLAAMREVAAVAAAVGAPSAIPVEERYEMNRLLGAFRSSMLQDFEAGRALELGALVDAVVEIGGRLGVAAPLVDALGALARRAVVLRDRPPS